MKLLNKITLWFIGVVFLITPLTMFVSYNNIKHEIDAAEVESMKDANERIATQIAQGQQPDRFARGRAVEVDVLKGALPAEAIQSVESNAYNENLKRNETLLTVSSYKQIAGVNYKISSHNYVTKSEQIFSAMMKTLFWKMLFIVLAVSATASLLSRQVFSPFRQTMKAIKQFNVRQKEKIRLPRTSTREFGELNRFLEQMTEKAMEDYASVKEFSENASHELQTPLAVIRSKMELLADTPIDESQAALIEDMQHAIEKLSRINRSLLLLTKLENKEFDSSKYVRLCTVTREVLAAYSDRIALKEISINKQIDKEISLMMHPTLAEILLSNLLSNAVRHNIEGGSIDISLSAGELRISNTGRPPETATEELFKRFKKSNQCDDSIGLGLAIVKQICEVSNFAVSYDYAGGLHTVSVTFGASQHLRMPVPAQVMSEHEAVVA